jgi:hypothetical protein
MCMCKEPLFKAIKNPVKRRKEGKPALQEKPNRNPYEEKEKKKKGAFDNALWTHKKKAKEKKGYVIHPALSASIIIHSIWFAASGFRTTRLDTQFA